MSILFASRAFSVETTIHASLDAVREAISSLDKFLSLNPAMVACVAIPCEPDLYEITDRLRFCGIPYSFRYRARTHFFAEGIDSEVWAPLGFHHIGQIRFVSVPEGTCVRDQVEMETPRLLADYSLRNAEQAHREMLSRLKKRLEHG